MSQQPKGKKEIHVMPYTDGSRYKNGKLKIKWKVVEIPVSYKI